MAIPTYQGFNAAASASGSIISVAPYGFTTSGDIIITYVMSKYAYPDAPGAFTAYTSGETKITQIYHSYLFGVAIFWYRVSGSVPTSFSYLHANSGCPTGAISLTFRGCVASGTPYDFEIEQAGRSSSPWYASSGTTLGADRLLVSGHVNTNPSAIYANGTYYSSAAQGSIGSYFYGALMTEPQASAGTTPSDSGLLYNCSSEIGLTFALKPPYPHKVNGVAAANIGKVNGVATANIGKVNGV